MESTPRPVWGLAGFIFAVLALVLVSLPMAGMMSPPEKKSGTLIGEIAADIRIVAKKAMTKEPQTAPAAPATRSAGLEQILPYGAVLAAVVAMILGVIAMYRREVSPLSKFAVIL